MSPSVRRSVGQSGPKRAGSYTSNAPIGTFIFNLIGVAFEVALLVPVDETTAIAAV